MQTTKTLRTRIPATLANLSYPIRTAKDLASQLEGQEVASFRYGTSCLAVGAALTLLHPRDFLFTNAQQIAELLATRVTIPEVETQRARDNMQSIRIGQRSKP